MLEALGQYGYRADQPQVDRALAFIGQDAGPRRGCWIGRWGVNYLYGTWQVLLGLEASASTRSIPMVRTRRGLAQECAAARRRLGRIVPQLRRSVLAGQGTPTASQTAWALLGLIAAGEADSDAVRAGIDYLSPPSEADGSWHEEQFTGTGFPKVFYLKYHMYRLYFPLMALARFAQAIHAKSVAREPSIHLFKDEG